MKITVKIQVESQLEIIEVDLDKTPLDQLNENQREAIRVAAQHFIQAPHNREIRELDDGNISFDPPIVIRESKKHAGKKVVTTTDKELGAGSFGHVFSTIDLTHIFNLTLDYQEKKQKKNKILKVQNLYEAYKNRKKGTEEFKAAGVLCDFLEEQAITKELIPGCYSTTFPEIGRDQLFQLRRFMNNEIHFNNLDQSVQGIIQNIQTNNCPLATIMMPNLGEFLYKHTNDESTLQRKFPEFTDRIKAFNLYMKDLSFIHERGYIHGDLKTDNALLHEQMGLNGKVLKRVRNIDFGYTKEKGSSSSALYGTPLYIPPEVLSQTPRQVSESADVYSSGIIMLEMIFSDASLTNITGTNRGLAHALPNMQEPVRLKIGGLINSTTIIPKEKKAFFKNFALGMIEYDPQRRPSMQTAQTAQSLMLLSENAFQFIESGEGFDKLPQEDKIKLFNLIQKGPQNNIKEALDFFEQGKLEQIRALVVQPQNNDFLKMLGDIDNEYPDITLRMLTKIFNDDLTRVSAIFSDVPLDLATVNPDIFNHFHAFQNDVLYYADELQDKYGFDFTDKSALEQTNDFALQYFNHLTSQSEKINLYRKLPADTQKYIRDQTDDLNTLLELTSSFHNSIHNVSDCLELLSEKPINHAIIYKNDDVAEKYYIAYKDKSDQINHIEISISGYQYVIDNNKFDDIDSLIKGIGTYKKLAFIPEQIKPAASNINKNDAQATINPDVSEHNNKIIELIENRISILEKGKARKEDEKAFWEALLKEARKPEYSNTRISIKELAQKINQTETLANLVAKKSTGKLGRFQKSQCVKLLEQIIKTHKADKMAREQLQQDAEILKPGK